MGSFKDSVRVLLGLEGFCEGSIGFRVLQGLCPQLGLTRRALVGGFVMGLCKETIRVTRELAVFIEACITYCITGVCSNQGETSLNFHFILVPSRNWSPKRH